jgi:UDP-glucose 4-epimerase
MPMKKILVVGGAGYIGSHMVKMLLQKQHHVVILDDLSSGHRDAVLGGDFILGSLADTALLNGLFAEHHFDGVMHFASFIQVGESMLNPGSYYRNNVTNTLNLLETMVNHKVLTFLFSSTAAIFGEPLYTPINETHPKNPINPYGRSKLMVEEILADFDHAYGLKSICLRYFNAAGADAEGQLGERHDPETHLIPLVLQAAAGMRPYITVFGQDYDTPDGTCIRDYIHVEDLCQAHLLAIEKLWDGAPRGVYNLGNGEGFSVREVIDAAREVTGREIPVQYGARREGDPARLVADSGLARVQLGWQSKYPEIEKIIEHAWRWILHGSKHDS